MSVFHCSGSDELPGQTNNTNLGAPDENKKIETHSTNETPMTTPEGQQVGTYVFYSLVKNWHEKLYYHRQI